jgi:putative membrane protein
LRRNLGLKGRDFYVHNPLFWTKMALFVVVGLISIIPTVAYISWRRRASADGSIVLDDAELSRTRGLVLLQIAVPVHPAVRGIHGAQAVAVGSPSR